MVSSHGDRLPAKWSRSLVQQGAAWRKSGWRCLQSILPLGPPDTDTRWDAGASLLEAPAQHDHVGVPATNDQDQASLFFFLD